MTGSEPRHRGAGGSIRAEDDYARRGCAESGSRVGCIDVGSILGLKPEVEGGGESNPRDASPLTNRRSLPGAAPMRGGHRKRQASVSPNADARGEVHGQGVRRVESGVGFHTFRHSCATLLFRNGWNAVHRGRSPPRWSHRPLRCTPALRPRPDEAPIESGIKCARERDVVRQPPCRPSRGACARRASCSRTTKSHFAIHQKGEASLRGEQRQRADDSVPFATP